MNTIPFQVNQVLNNFRIASHQTVDTPNIVEKISPFSNFEEYPIDFENSTAIFNIVHGSLKQKNADLNPVGVAFVPAYIPPNTYLYHATSSQEIPDLYEWIAMDYEFSYNFAGFGRNKARSHGFLDKKKSRDEGPPHLPRKGKGPFKGPRRQLQYLYSFKTTAPLTKLIYLDGASASKNDNGQMDQQLILSNQTDINGHVNEYEAAEKICKWGESFGLQGVIRLEVGFEIIICNFSDSIELVSNVTLNNVTNLLNFPNELPEPRNNLEKERSELIDILGAMSGYEHIQAGSIADNREPRILLDFSRMVTPINKTWIDPDPYRRRINSLSFDIKEDILNSLEENLSLFDFSYEKTDWQLITNRMVDKFGPILVLLNSSLTQFEHLSEEDLRQALETVSGNLTQYTYNFIRRYSDDTIEDPKMKRQKAMQESINDYVYHTFALTTEAEKLIYSSVFKIQSVVATHIFDIFDISREILFDLYVEPSENNFDKYRKDLLAMKKSSNDLLDTLGWSIFTQCFNKCNWDEVCYIPTWGPGPMGFGPDKQKLSRWFLFDGETYRIAKDLQCISFKDI